MRLFAILAHRVRRVRRVLLHLSNTTPWVGIALTGITRLDALAAPGLTGQADPNSPHAPG